MTPEEDKTDVLESAKEFFRKSVDAISKWRREAEEDYAFVAGDQWDDETISRLNEQMRPVITFNRIGPIVDAISGAEIQNRSEIKYLPREPDDTGLSDTLNAAAMWVRDQCDAEDEESEAFTDVVICGMGVTETHLDYEEEWDGKIIIERVDPLEMFWDGEARKRNLDDARAVMRVKEMTVADAKALFPEKETEIELCGRGPWDEVLETVTDSGPDDHLADQYARPGGGDGIQRLDKDMIRVAEYQWYERETVWRVFVNGDMTEFTPEDYERLKSRFEVMGIEAVKQAKKIYKRAFICGDEVLSSGNSPCQTGFTYHFITGKRDRNKNTFYGLVRAMKDPQRWANKFFSQILHVINSNAKGGLLAEEGSFADQNQAEQDWARTDSIVWARQGAISGKQIIPKPQAPYPQGIDRMMEFAIDAHFQTTGVNLEMLGMVQRNQPGVLEYQRRQAGMTILASLFDSLRRYRKDQGRTLLYYMRKYISDGRLIRVVGSRNAEYVPLIKGEETKRYDVIVDEAASSPNQKERVFQIIMEMLPTISKMGLPMPVELLDYSPLPESLTEKWREKLQEGGGQLPPEVQQRMQQMQEELQKAQQENQQLKMGQQVKMQEQQFKSALETQEFQHEKALDMRRLAHEFQIDQGELELAAWKAAEEIKIKEQQARQNAEAQRNRANGQGNS